MWMWMASCDSMLTVAGMNMADRVRRGEGTPQDVCDLAGLCAILMPGHDSVKEWRHLLSDCSRFVRIRREPHAPYHGKTRYYIGRR